MSKLGEKGSMLARDMLVGLAIIGLIILVIVIIISVLIYIPKGIGVLLIIFGIFMMGIFPDIKDVQPENFSKTGILIGLALIIIGALILLYL